MDCVGTDALVRSGASSAVLLVWRRPTRPPFPTLALSSRPEHNEPQNGSLCGVEGPGVSYLKRQTLAGRQSRHARGIPPFKERRVGHQPMKYGAMGFSTLTDLPNPAPTPHSKSFGVGSIATQSSKTAKTGASSARMASAKSKGGPAPQDNYALDNAFALIEGHPPAQGISRRAVRAFVGEAIRSLGGLSKYQDHRPR
jgi:hypothetical protein